jgi:hypothetical protein
MMHGGQARLPLVSSHQADQGEFSNASWGCLIDCNGPMPPILEGAIH